MRTSRIITGVLCMGLLVALAAAAQVAAPSSNKEEASQPPAKTQPASHAAVAQPAAPVPAAESADEAAIRGVVDAFTKAYDAGDAKAISALFMPDAEIVSEDGTTLQGRDAVETEFAGVFKQHAKATIKSDIKSIRFVSPTLAIEEGTSIVTHDPNEPPEHTRYEVVHVKQPNGKWLMASARDLPDEGASGEDQLNQLHWLIGDWVDEDPNSLVQTSYRWSENHHFILSHFTVSLNGQSAMTGSQRIGWDPLGKTIRSWAFDSEGGFREAVWSREGNQWIVKSTGVTNDGKPASATSYLTRLHKHRLTWESRDRVVGGEKMPDVGPITIARQPPTPGTVSSHSSRSKTSHSEPGK